MRHFLQILCCLLLSIGSVYAAKPTASVSGTLPVIYIQTTDNAPIDSKETYVSGTLSIDPLNTGMPALNEVAAQFKGRGNWTWSGFDKKPYKIKFDTKQSVLGMPKNKYWCLLAHADDYLGYLKNTVGFMLSEQIGLRWTPRFQPVELVLNGTYQGLYFLTEHVRIGSNRVNITEQADNATDSVSGGWLVEIDNYSSEGNITFHEGNGQYVMVSLKEPEVLSAQQRDYIEQQIYTLNDAIYGASATQLWGMMDVEEAAKYYLVQEIMEDCESYHGSCYLYKDRDRNGIVDKWKFGPVWDFGNAFDRQQQTWIYDRPVWPQYWIGQIAQWPEFQTKVSENWYTYYHSYLSATRSRIADFVTSIEQAARNDAERWRGSQGYCDNSHMEDRKNDFLNRFNSRIDWLYSQWGEGTQPQTQDIDEIIVPDGKEIVNRQSSNRKYIKDGRILILRGDKTYTLTGQEVK